MELLPESLEQYIATHSDPEPPLLAELARQTHLKVLYPRMLSGHLQGRVLAHLSKLIRPKYILEIGTYTGYSALCLAEGLAEGGKLVTMDPNPETNAFAQGYFDRSEYADRIELRAVKALEALPELAFSPDLVFLDAVKEEYLDYFEAVLPKMPSGGIVLTDNVLWSGKVVDKSFAGKDTEAIRKFNTAIRNDPRVERVLLPVRDGLFLIRKR